GPGSTSILTSIALAASGPGTSVVFGNPSFVVYRLAALLAGAEQLDGHAAAATQRIEGMGL
ncbi:MAG: hypothetical protein QGG31_06975, partial [Anaerolineales bacterium]|nr:hypothetical protein [Anaerolineales bacterium]